MIGIIVVRWVPTVGANLSDAVAASLYVLPESRDVWSLRQNRTDSHNCDCTMSCIFHDSTPYMKYGNASGQ
jgi:hypothetical protein